MALLILTIALLIVGSINTAPTDDGAIEKIAAAPQTVEESDDLKVAASSSPYGRSYIGSSSGYGVTGYGLLDSSRYNYNSGLGGYNNPYGYNSYSGGNPGYGGYGGAGSGLSGYGGYGSNSFSGYGGAGGYNSFAGNPGYGGYGGPGGYNNYAGNGGYGGYGGNGGLTSYYGYNNPSYQEANHLGPGYYSRRPGGSIYNSGITPSLVTGYRGYSRR